MRAEVRLLKELCAEVSVPTAGLEGPNMDLVRC